MFPIFALWCHPRSMSTAIERVMRERGDLQCFHEPFMHYYYVHRSVRIMPHFEPDPGRPSSYPAIREQLLRTAERSPVFIKDMSFYALPRLLDDAQFCRRLVNAFLVRDPVQSILSYHRLDPDVTCEEIGIEAQWRHFCWLKDHTGEEPVVLDAGMVRHDSIAILSAYWNRVGLSEAPHAFEWNVGQDPEEWAQVAGWHRTVLASNRIRGVEPDVSTAAQCELERRAVAAPHILEYLQHHQVYYDRLREHALRF